MSGVFERVGVVGGGLMGSGIADSLYAEFAEPLYAPPPLLCRMTDARLLGRKTARGFHDDTEESA